MGWHHIGSKCHTESHFFEHHRKQLTRVWVPRYGKLHVKMRMSLRTERFSGREWSQHLRSCKQDTATYLPLNACSLGGEMTCTICTNLSLQAKHVPLNLHTWNVHCHSLLFACKENSLSHIVGWGACVRGARTLVAGWCFCCLGSSEEPTPSTVRMEDCTLSVRNFALFLCCLARCWSYNWASLAAKTCSRLKQGWWVKINPEISMSSWKFPEGSPDPIMCWLLWTYFTAC